MNIPSIKITTMSFLLLFSASSAWATYDNPTCDNVCAQIVDTSTDQVLNTSGADGWTAADTAWCGANPTTNVSGGAAGATTIASLTANSNTATNQNRCQYHNSQVLTYCLAYDATTSSDGMEIPLLALDIGAAATCGVVCAESVGSPVTPWSMACRVSSTAASAAQILDELTQSNGGVSKDIGALLGAAGIANEALGAFETNGLQISDLVSYLKGSDGLTQNGANMTSTSGKISACVSAALMTAMAALRVKDLASHAVSKQTACQDVLNLLGTQPVITASTGTASGAAGSTAGASAGVAGSSISGSGAASASGLGQIAGCAQTGITSCPNAGQMSAATDGGILNSTGLGPLAGAALANQDLPALANAINSGQSAGSMISGAMKGQGVDTFADSLKNIADDMQKNLNALPALAPYSGAGAGGSAKATQSTFGKGFDFGGGPTAAPSSEVKFERTPAATADGDIWHEGYKGSIFQIVSTRIVETKDRIHPMDWSTPLNRALMGLPAQKDATKGATK